MPSRAVEPSGMETRSRMLRGMAMWVRLLLSRGPAATVHTRRRTPRHYRTMLLKSPGR
ncbi:hypothetical protein GCM10022294_28790 [Dietzia aurantiaca]